MSYITLGVDIDAVGDALEDEVDSAEVLRLIKSLLHIFCGKELEELDAYLFESMRRKNIIPKEKKVDPLPARVHFIEADSLSKLAAFLKTKGYSSLTVNKDGLVTFN